MLYLDPGEHVLLEVRKHWIVFVSEAFAHIVLAVLPILFLELYRHFAPASVQVHIVNSTHIGIFLYSMWILILWISFFVQWTKYYLTVWYVTEKRIIDVEQRKLFSRDVSNLRFDKIQDITIGVKGLLETFLDIGDIEVQTAAEDSGDFTMARAAHPDKVRSFIFAQHNQASEQYIPQKTESSV